MNTKELQKNYFLNIGLSYDEGENKLNNIYSNQLSDFKKTNSQHQILFSSISKKIKAKKILEIGTLDGTNALFMSKLFKESEITTIDLPDEDKMFINTYNRENSENRKKFILYRDHTLSLSQNINFIKIDSLKYLTITKSKFDLIWVDGAHGSPEVVIDITNSLKLINKKGYLVCDDIFIKEIKDDQVYRSTAGFKTLLSFARAGIIREFSLIIKKFNNKDKFIAVVKGTNINF